MDTTDHRDHDWPATLRQAIVKAGTPHIAEIGLGLALVGAGSALATTDHTIGALVVAAIAATVGTALLLIAGLLTGRQVQQWLDEIVLHQNMNAAFSQMLNAIGETLQEMLPPGVELGMIGPDGPQIYTNDDDTAHREEALADEIQQYLREQKGNQ